MFVPSYNHDWKILRISKYVELYKAVFQGGYLAEYVKDFLRTWEFIYKVTRGRWDAATLAAV